MATVPDSEKKRLDVTLKLKDAKFKPGLKDTDSEEYQRLRNNVEDAVSCSLYDLITHRSTVFNLTVWFVRFGTYLIQITTYTMLVRLGILLVTYHYTK